MASDAKQQLVDFVVEKALEPVMHKRSAGLSEADKQKLDYVQKATRSEIERYRGYSSAREVVTNFHRDLDSEPAKKVHRELESLHLPTIADIREEFDRKAQDLGIRS